MPRVDKQGFLQRLQIDVKYRTATLSVLRLIFNLLYAFYNGALGLATGSVWFITSCVYHLILSATRFAAVNFHKKSRRQEIGAMLFSGAMLAVLSTVLCVMLYISLTQNIASKYGTITMLTITTYTFTKLMVAIVKAKKHIRDKSPLRLSVRVIRWAEIAVSVFTMQKSMLVSFGEIVTRDAYILNAFTGSAMCLFTLWLGIYLIKKSKKELRKWKKRNP